MSNFQPNIKKTGKKKKKTMSYGLTWEREQESEVAVENKGFLLPRGNLALFFILFLMNWELGS